MDKSDASASTPNPFAPKDHEMMSTIANIKREIPPNENSAEYQPVKKVPLFIKKEPGDEPLDNGSSTNSSTDILSDMKIANDIKTEAKCGLDLSDTDTKMDDASRDSNIRYNPLHKPEPHPRYSMDMGKPPNEPLKFGIDTKYPLVAADLSQKYETKPMADLAVHKMHQDNADKSNSDANMSEPPKNFYGPEPIETKYQPHNIDMKYPENMAIKRPPYTEPAQNMRSPYDSPMHKYVEAMHKYPPGVPPIMSSPLGGKYILFCFGRL